VKARRRGRVGLALRLTRQFFGVKRRDGREKKGRKEKGELGKELDGVIAFNKGCR